MAIVKILCCLLLTSHLTEGRKIKVHNTVGTHQETGLNVGKSVFKLYSEGDTMRDLCTLEAVEELTLKSCGFNSSNPLIIINHGWSVDGMMESWIFRLASALKTHHKDANIMITDWLPLARQHYPTAVLSTRAVGHDIASLLRRLQDLYNFSTKRVHLIGYSLGAHISGFAGSYFKGSEKIGRITGLDPAGPLFEGMSPIDRLSPDDADFVDAIHTFTRESMGWSVGIQQPVAHFDFYPNGGSVQPGCDLHNLYEHVTEYGVHGLEQTIKCSHERSVHLLIDSLQNKDKQSIAYMCNDNQAFEKGMCLDCRKNRCNTLGYNVKQVRTGSSKRLYLRTRSWRPYKLYHYQFKVQFINQLEKMRPSLTIALTGTKEESRDLPIHV